MKTLYQRWFIEFNFPNEEGKPYKASGGKMIYNETLKKNIPNGWQLMTLGDILEQLECGDRPVGGADNTGIPSIGAENITGIGQYNFANEKYIPVEYFSNMKKGVIKSWDVLLYKDGAGVGQVSMFGDGFPYEKCAINSHVFILRTKDNFYQNYLYLTLNQEYMKKILVSLSMKAAQPGLNQPSVKSIRILVPDGDLLNLFNCECNLAFHKVFSNANENHTLTSLRDFILPMLMNGQISVDDIEI